MITICEKRSAILASDGHVLICGGPGSGKTTIALLKAHRVAESLKPGEEILFLSFSKAAIRQIVSRAKTLISSQAHEAIKIQTYHSFCLEVLESKGQLLRSKPLRILFPDEERIQKAEFQGDWLKERQRKLDEECVLCFDHLACKLAELLERSHAVRALYAKKYPLIVVDEFQDTDDDQWRIVNALRSMTSVLFLADPEQRIFEYRANINPLRLQLLRQEVAPLEYDLGTENHRSGATGILDFANALLRNQPLPKTNDVKQITYYGKAFAATVHASVVWTFSHLRQREVESPSLAVLCRSNAFVAQLSAILSEEHIYNGTTLRPIDHDVAWDAELAAAAAQVVASIMEWPTKACASAIADTLEVIAYYYRLKNSENPSKAAAEAFGKAKAAAPEVRQGRKVRSKAVDALIAAWPKVQFTGDPVKDWRNARGLLYEITTFNEIFREARLVRLFRATDALASGLATTWIAEGDYRNAANLVKGILDRERLIAAERDPEGCVLMTIHKSKGKEFDGVVIVEGSYASPLFDTQREKPPFDKSRRLIRVAITRARSCVTIVRPNNGQPFVT